MASYWKKWAAMLGMLAFFGPVAHAAPTAQHIKRISNNTKLKPKVIKLALKAHQYALRTGKVKKKDLLTIVDYSMASNLERMYVIDLKDDAVLMKLRVAHGNGSGTKHATSFSNLPNSHKSSLGTFITGETYVGKHGLSRRVDGIEAGINTNARSRAIVIHAAPYVSKGFGQAHPNLGLGRSQGCLAVNPSQSTKLINQLGSGSVIFSYAAPEDHDPHLRNVELS